MDAPLRSPRKAELRAEYLAARRELVARQGAGGRRHQAEQLCRIGLDWVGTAPRTVTAYVAFRTEPPVDLLVEQLLAQGHQVLLPLTPAIGFPLDWYRADDPDQTPLGPEALSRVDVAFTPGLAVDRHGVRLGKGGGFYDRSLPFLRPGIGPITILHDHEVVETLPADAHDMPVAGTLTAAGGVRLIS